MKPWMYWLGWIVALVLARIVLVNPILARLDALLKK